MEKLQPQFFIAICVMLGFGPEEWAEFLITGSSTLLTPRMAQSAFLILGLVTFTALVWNKIFSLITASRIWLGRIFDNIEWIDKPHSIHSFGYIISKPHNLALVGHIQLKGKNTRKSSIIVEKAFLRSLVTGEQIDAEIEHLKAEDIEIYRGVNFTVMVKFPNEDGHLAQNSISGISFQSFLKRFSNFEIIIETDKKTYRIEFNSNETQEWVSSVQTGLMMQPPRDKARVLKRADNRRVH